MGRNPQARCLVVTPVLPQCEGKNFEAAKPAAARRMTQPKRCGNNARYDLDGHKLCGRHAGAYALRIILGEDGGDLLIRRDL